MNRSAARAAASAALIATGAYTVAGVDQVYQGAPETFGGRSPVAVVSSRSMSLQVEARGLYEVTSVLTISIYVRIDAGSNGVADAENQLDSLMLAAQRAVHATGQFIVGTSDAFPEAAPRRLIDGIAYRVERLPVTAFDEGSD